jgi:hypothetical protein
MLVILGCTARTDHMFFVSIIYFLYNFDTIKTKTKSFIAKTGFLFAVPIIFTVIVSEIIYPKAEYYMDLFQYNYNITNSWTLIYPLIFLSLPILFSNKIKQIVFYKKTWLWIIPFILVNFLVARTSEVRLFLPLLAYSIPFIINGIVQDIFKINNTCYPVNTGSDRGSKQ